MEGALGGAPGHSPLMVTAARLVSSRMSQLLTSTTSTSYCHHRCHHLSVAYFFGFGLGKR